MWDKIWATIIFMGLGMLFAALLLSAITVSVGISKAYNEKALENESISKAFQEQRKVLFYDNTHVYQQDIVSLILRTRGERTILFCNSTGTVIASWGPSNSKQDSYYEISYLASKLPGDIIYDSSVRSTTNSGQIDTYIFTRHVDGCGR